MVCIHVLFMWIKKHFWVTFMIVVFLNEHGAVRDPFYLDLPEKLKPLRYELNILTDITSGAPHFRGYVFITIKCVGVTKEIVLNAKNIYIVEEISVRLTFTPATQFIGILKKEFDVENDWFIITLEQFLEYGKIYILRVGFSQNFSNAMHGYSLYTYQRFTDNKPKWLTVSNFADVGARVVFPCFDQKNMKAEFKITHVHPNNVIGVSNGKLKSTKFYSPGYVSDEFDKTVPMATSNLQIALFAFKSNKIVKPGSNIEIQILADRTIFDDTNHLFDTASRILEFYSNFYNIPYSLKKLDVIVLPNSSLPDSESYGVIFVSEPLVLASKKNTKIISTAEYTLFSSMCYVISKQWIGNFVTMSLKRESWFHIGLNRLFQTVCVKNVLPMWESSYTDLGVVDSYFHVFKFEVEQSCWSSEMDRKPYFFKQLERNREEKAYHLVRMLEFIMGSEVLKDAVRAYLGQLEFQLANSTLSDALFIFTKTMDSRNEELLPKIWNLTDVMESWDSCPGIPLIRVTRNYKNGIVTLKQEVFQPFKDIQLKKYGKPCWITPLSYTTRAERNFGKVTVRKWLSRSKLLEIDISANKDDWILINMKLSVLARVSYDKQNWKLIQKDFLNENEFEVFDVINRTKLISDMFALAEAKELSYRIVFDTMRYLIKEKHFTPWECALKEFSIIRFRLFRSPLLEPFEKYVKSILESVYEVEKDHVKYLLKVAMIRSACEFGLHFCIEKSSKFLTQWDDDFLKKEWLSIPSIIQEDFLCQGIKFGDEDQWNILQGLYIKKKEPLVRKSILKALGCSTKTKVLEKYLKWSLDKKISPSDSLLIFESLSSNEKGYTIMKKFFIKHYDEISSIHSGKGKVIFTYLIILLNATTRQTDFDNLINFAESVNFFGRRTHMQHVNHSFRQAIKNIEWLEMNEKKIGKLLQQRNFQ